MNRCPVCNDVMSLDRISETVILLQCPTCEHEEYEAVDTSDMPTQPVATIVDRGSVTIDGQFGEHTTDENGEDTIITRRELDEGR